MRRAKEHPMLWLIAIVLGALWGLGLITSYTLGGYLHIFLVVAVVVLAAQMLRGRRVT
jgi:hypothetical protein